MIIRTKQGEEVQIDGEDFELVCKYSWSKSPSCRYVAAYVNGKTTGIHRLITGAVTGSNVDHINGDTLDNRKENLRPCTHAENMKNRKPNIKGASMYKGVVVLPSGRFRSKIDSDGERYELGVYDNERDAVIAYNAAAKVLHGEHCYLNNLPENTRANTPQVSVGGIVDDMVEVIQNFEFIADYDKVTLNDCLEYDDLVKLAQAIHQLYEGGK